MLTREKVIETLKEKNMYLKQKYNIKKIGLFGSFAKGEPDESSDVDIFVEFEKPIGIKFIEFAEYIENLLGKRVDIITPEGIKGIRIGRIIKDIEGSMRYV